MMPSNQDIRALSELARSRGLGVLEVADTGWSVRISAPGGAERQARPMPSPASPPEAVPVTSPGVGTFLPTHPARSAAFGGEGDAVAAGAVLGLVASGAVCRAVLAPCAGTLARCLAPAGACVGFGTALFTIIPAQKDQT